MARSFSTKSLGDLIAASHVNDLQTAVQDLEDGVSRSGSDTGAADAYAVALPAALPSPMNTGFRFIFKATNANTGAATLALNGGSALPLKRRDGSALQAGDIQAGQMVQIAFDGTNYMLLSQDASGGNLALDDLSDVTLSTPAKGHVLVHNGTGWVNLGPGTDGQVLKADSTAAHGVAWAASSGGGLSGLAKVEQDIYEQIATAPLNSGVDYKTTDGLWIGMLYLARQSSGAATWTGGTTAAHTVATGKKFVVAKVITDFWSREWNGGGNVRARVAVDSGVLITNDWIAHSNWKVYNGSFMNNPWFGLGYADGKPVSVGAGSVVKPQIYCASDNTYAAFCAVIGMEVSA